MTATALLPTNHAATPSNSDQTRLSDLEMVYRVQLDLEERFAAYMLQGYGRLDSRMAASGRG